MSTISCPRTPTHLKAQVAQELLLSVRRSVVAGTGIPCENGVLRANAPITGSPSGYKGDSLRASYVKDLGAGVWSVDLRPWPMDREEIVDCDQRTSSPFSHDVSKIGLRFPSKIGDPSNSDHFAVAYFKLRGPVARASIQRFIDFCSTPSLTSQTRVPLPTMIGQSIAHYRILEKLGEGGMGVVYRAFDDQLQREVALKVLPVDSLSDLMARARLRREAQTAAALNHPNVCVVYEVGEADGILYIAMELVKGRTVPDLVSDGLSRNCGLSTPHRLLKH